MVRQLDEAHRMAAVAKKKELDAVRPLAPFRSMAEIRAQMEQIENVCKGLKEAGRVQEYSKMREKLARVRVLWAGRLMEKDSGGVRFYFWSSDSGGSWGVAVKVFRLVGDQKEEILVKLPAAEALRLRAFMNSQ